MKVLRLAIPASVAGMACMALLVLQTPEHPGAAVRPVPPGEKRTGRGADRPSPTAQAVALRSPETSWREIENALPLVWLEQDPLKRGQMMQAVLNKVPLAEIPLILTRLQAAPERELGLELSAQLARRWAESDPSSAAVWAEQLPAGRNRRNNLEQVALAWAGLDPVAAADWACYLPAEEEWRQALETILSETVRVAPRTALAMARELSADFARDEIILRATAEWAADAPAEATVWARQIDDPELRERALSAIALALGERDPQAAARLALGALPPGRLQDDAVMGIVQRWAQTAPAQAAAWVERFPTGEIKSTAIENLALIWADRDSGQALRWLKRLPPAVAGQPVALPVPLPN